MRENELKFAPSATFALPEFGPDTGVTVIEKLPIQNLRAVYYDTDDLRLSQAGATLRYRTGEQDHAIWTLKLPIPGDSATAREEISAAAEGRSTPPEISDLTTAFIRSDKLLPVTTLKTKRRRWMLRDDSGAEMAELVDDDVSVLEGRKVVGRFREIEVEQRAATGKQLKRIARSLREAGAVDAEPIPKASRALSLRAETPDPPGAPNDDGSVGAALTAALKADLERLVIHDPVARIGKDPEGVHQMRVATRRIRSNIKAYGELIDESWAAETGTDLKWLAKLLGEVRDLDVLQERLKNKAEGIDGLRPLFESLIRQHRRARSRLLEGLRSDRYRLLIEMLVTASRQMPVNELASEDASTATRSIITRLWSEMASEARSLGGGATDDQKHQIRIQAKRLRYAIEAAAPRLGNDGREAKRFADRLADLQDVLGEHQDARVARETLTAMGTRGTKDALFCIAIGRLIERETLADRDSQAMFSEAWGKVDRKKNLSWLKG